MSSNNLKRLLNKGILNLFATSFFLQIISFPKLLIQIYVNCLYVPIIFVILLTGVYGTINMLLLLTYLRLYYLPVSCVSYIWLLITTGLSYITSFTIFTINFVNAYSIKIEYFISTFIIYQVIL